MSLIKIMRSDLLKMKHTSYFLIHIIIPVLTAVAVMFYYNTVQSDKIGRADGFLEIIAMGFPLIIGVVCSMVIEREALAGKFKEMLCSKYGKLECLLSKLLLLLISGFISFSLSAAVYYIGIKYIFKKDIIDVNVFSQVSLIVFASMIALYIFHLWVSICFGSGASITIGVFESVLSTLLITALGDGIWQFIPCAWGNRFNQNYFLINCPSKYTSKLDMSSIICTNNTAMLNCAIFTVMVGIFLAVWFNYFEGREEV